MIIQIKERLTQCFIAVRACRKKHLRGWCGAPGGMRKKICAVIDHVNFFTLAQMAGGQKQKVCSPHHFSSYSTESIFPNA